MKKYILLISLCICSLLGACTHNDGDIGYFFGQWKLVEITADDKVLESYGGNMFWSFQSSTIEVKTIGENHVATQSFGDFRNADNTLFLSFPDTKYPPPYFFGNLREIECQIVHIDHKTMTLSFVAPQASSQGYGATLLLKFKKW